MNKMGCEQLDEQLQQLAMRAQQHPPLTQERQMALTKLVSGILHSARLCHPQRGQFLGVYEDIYAEALQELLFYICQYIDKYNPERGSVLAWCNVLLERRFFKEAIPKILNNRGLKKMTLPQLDNIAPSVEPPSLTEILQECIETDPENLFKQEHIRKLPTSELSSLGTAKNFREIMERHCGRIQFENFHS